MGPLELRQSVTGSEVTRCKEGEPLCRSAPDSDLDKPETGKTQYLPRKLATTESRQSICQSVCQSTSVALPSGLIQIKGRRGFYTNITVPLKHRKTLGKSVIQKKAGDTLQEAQKKLWEEQSKARDLFQRLEEETVSYTHLRAHET